MYMYMYILHKIHVYFMHASYMKYYNYALQVLLYIL